MTYFTDRKETCMGHLAHPVDDILRIDETSGGIEKDRHLVTATTNIAAGYSVRVVTDRDDFYALENEWDLLAAPSKNPLLQFAWYASCAEAFSHVGSIVTVVVQQRDNVVAIAPLWEVRSSGMSRYEILGSSILCEPCGLLYKEKAALTMLINALFNLKKPISTGRLNKVSPEMTLFASESAKRFALHAYRSTYSPWLPISASWDEYQKTISSSKRSSLRRAFRHAREYGTVTMDVIAPGAGDARQYLDEMYAVEHASWKARTKTSIRSNPHVEKFFNAYAERMAHAGSLRLSLLKINGSTVAGQIGIVFADRFWVLKVGYDERFSNCSPGILLMHHTIQHAFENGLQAFEFLGRDEQWLRMWTTQAHQYTSYWHYPVNAAGLVWLVKDGYTVASTKIKTLLNGKNHDKKN